MNSQLGKKFRRLREDAGLTQAQVAKFLGVDQSYVSKFEAEKRQLNMDLLMQAATLFGCSLDALFEDHEPHRPIPKAMRATGITDEDLEVIATMNKLALNLRYMQDLLGGDRE